MKRVTNCLTVCQTCSAVFDGVPASVEEANRGCLACGGKHLVLFHPAVLADMYQKSMLYEDFILTNKYVPRQKPGL